MARKKSVILPNVELRTRLFGDFSMMTEHELDVLYKALCPDSDPEKEMRNLASEIVLQKKHPPPPHVQSYLKQIGAEEKETDGKKKDNRPLRHRRSRNPHPWLNVTPGGTSVGRRNAHRSS